MLKYLPLVVLLPILTHAWTDEMETNGPGHFEGDMILNPAQQKDAEDGKFTYGSINTNLWTKVGAYVTIPYTTDGTIGTSQKAMRAIKASFADYHQYTCLRFVERQGERAYVHFRHGGGCSSPVGMTGGQNRITLGTGCWARSTVIHEIGHTIGLYHEQSRPDRDDHLNIRWENIAKGLEYNFKKQRRDTWDPHGTPYDYRSVMHYGKTAFGRGKVTLETKSTYWRDLVGIGSGFSDIDVKQINLMYGCPEYKGIVEKVKQTPDCHDGTSYCEMMIQEHGCSVGWYARKCPFTCKKCTPGGGPPPTGPVPTRIPEPSKGPVTKPPPRTQSPGGDCKEISNCHEYAKWCGVASWKHFMERNCRRTCGLC